MELSKIGSVSFIKTALSIAIPAAVIAATLDIPLYLTDASMFKQQYIAFIWTLQTVLLFLIAPASKKNAGKGPRWYDVLFAVLTVPVGLYVTIYYPELLFSMSMVTPFQVVISAVALFLVLESTRRVVGWPILTIVIVFILYAKFGDMAPGIFRTKGLSWPRLLSQLYLGADSMFGTLLDITFLVIFGFILFGNFLFHTLGGEFLIRFASSIMGTYRGGAASTAVLASSLFGMLSGSAVANVASVGSITIPMMKKYGYSPIYAGGIESVASSGGQIMPPVMGAAAFVMAEFLGMSYRQVAIAAFVPAALYYIGLFIQIYLQALKRDLKGVSREGLPPLKETLRDGWVFFIPLIVLILTLFVFIMPAGSSALCAAASVIIVSLFQKKTRATWTWPALRNTLEKTSKGMLELTAICAAAGFIVGIVGYTGLGLSLSRSLTAAAGNSLFLLALYTAGASTILGMGIPTTGCYVLLAVLVAPAMTSFGVIPLVAHLFIFYFGTLSMLTPPVCLAAFTAATMAGAPLWPLALRAMQLAIAAYVVPFIMLYQPQMCLIGSTGEVILTISLVTIGLVAICFTIEGQFFRTLSWIERVLFALGGLGLFMSSNYLRFGGLAIVICLVAVQFATRRRPVLA